MSEAISFVLSATKRKPVRSTLVPDAIILPPLGQNDNVQGRVTVVSETGDVTNPTVALPIDGSTGLTIWDGVSNVYAAGVIGAVQNTNQLLFQLSVASAALTNALALANFINAFFELRITVSAGQDEQMMFEPIVVRKTGSGAGVLTPPLTTPGTIYGWWITNLYGASNSIQSVVTAGLPTATQLNVTIASITMFYTLTAGTANPADPNGQIPPVDFNAITNQRYWLKTA